MSSGERAKVINAKPPQLVAALTMYPTSDGGRKSIAAPGFGCPCFPTKNARASTAYDGWPILGDQSISPGETRRVGFWFTSEEAPGIMRRAGTFYLWDGRFIGEAVVLSEIA